MLKNHLKLWSRDFRRLLCPICLAELPLPFSTQLWFFSPFHSRTARQSADSSAFALRCFSYQDHSCLLSVEDCAASTPFHFPFQGGLSSSPVYICFLCKHLFARRTHSFLVEVFYLLSFILLIRKQQTQKSQPFHFVLISVLKLQLEVGSSFLEDLSFPALRTGYLALFL